VKPKLILALALSSLAVLPLAAQAGPIDAQLATYKAAAAAADAQFTAFSAERGKAFHNRAFGGGKPDTPACASCHNENPRAAGRAPTGKVIEPVALSATPTRYADPAKVEKWFTRNCKEVLGRACSPQEKGDWLTYMAGQ
jgi:hypothetical protein